jgi:hypothetical protein
MCQAVEKHRVSHWLAEIERLDRHSLYAKGEDVVPSRNPWVQAGDDVLVEDRPFQVGPER